MELFAEQWKGMPAFQKSVYRQLAEGERQRYVKELRLWRAKSQPKQGQVGAYLRSVLVEKTPLNQGQVFQSETVVAMDTGFCNPSQSILPSNNRIHQSCSMSRIDHAKTFASHASGLLKRARSTKWTSRTRSFALPSTERVFMLRLLGLSKTQIRTIWLIRRLRWLGIPLLVNTECPNCCHRIQTIRRGCTEGECAIL